MSRLEAGRERGRKDAMERGLEDVLVVRLSKATPLKQFSHSWFARIPAQLTTKHENSRLSISATVKSSAEPIKATTW
jgi:hypothetical protein